LVDWGVDRIIQFGAEDFVKNGLSHFGFHDRTGNRYAINDQKHFLGLIGENNRLNWTAAAHQVFEGTPNLATKLNSPLYLDNLPETSSMDYFNEHLFVPTDLSPETGDLAVLRRAGTGPRGRQTL
jgi:hypothetical protein